MTREVTDVFVVMKGEVPDSIFGNNNATGSEHSTTITSYKEKEAVKLKTTKLHHSQGEWVGVMRWLNRGQGSHLYS